VISGITYNFLPFVVLPLYVALERIDPRLIEAATDLYASRLQAFLRVTLPLSIPGVFAASLLSFIPAVGDYLNAELLGSRNTTMIGNVIQRLYLVNNDYPQAAALSLILMLGILVSIFIYRRMLRGQELTV
jgi:spermidine/putrescine transport system permease protein